MFKRNDVCLVFADKPLRGDELHGIEIGEVVLIQKIIKGDYPIATDLTPHFRPCELKKIGTL